MQGDYLFDSDDVDSLDAVELAMALEEVRVDPPGADAADDDDETSFVRNRPPQHPRGSSGAAAKPKD